MQTRQQTIKSLKEEIDDLEGRLEEVNHIAEDWEDCFNEKCTELNELNEQTDRVYEENEKLKAEAVAHVDGVKRCTLSALRFGESVLARDTSELKAENEKLKEREKGIMDYEHAGILGCDSYERFCQAMCELEYDEKWISELKAENKKLKKENDLKTIINCKNCKYDKCEFYNKSGNSWCPRCKGLNYHEEDSDEEEYQVVGSTVNMDAFNKLKEDGMIPWAK